jgi:hypothetical protein
VTRFPFVQVSCIALVIPLGCSVLFVQGPPPNHTSLRYFDCTSSRMPPISDGVLGGLVALGSLGAAEEARATGESQIALVWTGVGLGLLGSAVYGWMKTDTCRAAKAALSVRLNDTDTPSPRSPARQRFDPWLAGGPAPQASPAPSSAAPTPGNAGANEPWGPGTPSTQPVPAAPTPPHP